MQNITDLKDKLNTKTMNLVLLTIATAGLYPVMWLFKHQDSINEIIGKEIAGNVFIIWLSVCIGLSMALTGLGEESLDIIAGLFSIGSVVLYVVWAFKAKSALQEYSLNVHKIDLRMNGFYTFLFNVYYINYCINDLPEAKRKQEILTGNAEASAG